MEVKIGNLKKEVKKQHVAKNPDKIEMNKILNVPKDMPIVKISMDKLFGTLENKILTTKDTYDKMKERKTIEALERAWEENEIRDVIINNYDFNHHKKYKIIVLTPSGWRENGRTMTGKQIIKHVNFEAYLDSDKNYVRNDDDKIFAIQITETN